MLEKGVTGILYWLTDDISIIVQLLESFKLQIYV